MEYATLGNTGLLVSKLCFGTMTFGDGRGLFKMIGATGQAGADELVKRSIDGGINFFDTADVYTEGQSEEILGQSLKNLGFARKDVVIATKVYGRVGPGRNDVGASRGHIMDAVEASLKRLVDRPYRPVPNPRQRFRHPCRRDPARARDPGPAGKGPLHRLLQLARVEDRQSPGDLRVQESGPIRHASGLLLDRRPRSRTGNRSAAGIRKRWSAGVESACRRPAFRKVQPGEPEARRFAPH